MRRNAIYPWLILMSLASIPILGYGGYCLNRWFNWHFGYESLVKRTVTEMIKPECLK